MIIELRSIDRIQARRVGRPARQNAGLHEDAMIDHVSVVYGASQQEPLAFAATHRSCKSLAGYSSTV